MVDPFVSFEDLLNSDSLYTDDFLEEDSGDNLFLQTEGLSELPDNSFSETSFSQTLTEVIEEEPAFLPEQPIIPDRVREYLENPPFVQEMLDEIASVDEYAWNRGSMGYDIGFEGLNKAFNGLNTGLTLFAGGSNTGRVLCK